MAIVFDSDAGTITGLSVGGLPDGIVDAGTLATNSVDSAELIDGAVDDSHMAAMAASKLTGALPAISGASLTAMPTGSVLQVVNATCSTEVDTSSSSYVATPLEATITPSSTSSKILITYSGAFYHYSGVQVSTTIYRGSTDIASVGNAYGVMRSWMESTRGFFLHGGQLLDSPSTTSATTYKVYIKKNSGSYSTSGPTAAADTFPSITLMEIAG